ncbi:membrane protein insertase YidC [Peribacillus cavernae]|uniref:Membrane protein insertase YidC n=1 Tax=Peribacillus cavernae TaxID=1674310 RepID=A0A433HQJ6_9BACI|nr:membrane protein insertase YidC [Peribacillus cavernae]
MVLVLALTGCSASPGKNDGFFHTVLVNPMTTLINFFADIFHGNFGISIILMTLLIRLLLMPLTIRQYKAQQTMKGKMEAFKPEMTAIQAKIKQTKDSVKQKELQQEMMLLYQKHGINPLNMGCLPALIQMPILMGFYYAIKGSHEIATHNFLWYNLGHADHIMAIIAGIIYYLQFRVSLQNMPVEQQNSMKAMGLLSPVMILFFSFNAPAALPLYWSIGGLFLMLQTLILQKRFKLNTEQSPEISAPSK